MTVRPAALRRAASRPAAALTAVLLAGALAACAGSGGGSDDAPAAPVAASGSPDDQSITVLGTEGLEYEPATITAAPGSLTITLAVQAGPPHDLVFDDDELPSIGTVAEGEQGSATYAFEGAGTYDFVCTFHPGMQGQVVVS